MMDTSTTTQEREHKFEVEDTFSMPDFGTLLSEADHVDQREPVVLEAVYFDTTDRTLAKAGVTLRRRTGGADAGWHLKSPDPESGARTEMQLPLGADAGSIPNEFERLLTDRLRNKRLRSMLRVRTQRTVTELFDSNGQLLVEVADDHVITVRLSDLALTTWREVEIEERAATMATFRRVEEILIAHGARISPYSSKMEHGLLDGSSPALSIDRPDPLTVRIREQVAALIACEADVRESRDDDAVHRMRVATRRLRSCLRTFRGAFSPDPTRHLNAELKWLGGHLGAERDAEVILERVTKELNALSVEQILGPVRSTLTALLRSEIVAAHDALIQAMNSASYRSLLEEVATFADQPAFRTSRRSNRWLRRQITRSVHRTKRRVERAQSFAGSDHDTALHEVRKAAKDVRYAAETLGPVFGRRVRPIEQKFERLQEVLGEHHDATVARSVFRQEGARAGVRPDENGFTYGLLYAREEANAASAEAAFEAVWKRAWRIGRKV